MGARAKVSLCMIVKDEEPWLAECLESAAPFISEAIIVDTGSTDGTVAIAERFGARVCHYRWIHDFAAARNFSLDQATGDWILVLDADERLDECQYRRFQHTLRRTNAAYEVRQRHYTEELYLASFVPCKGRYPLWERHYPGYFDTRLCRLFPNDPRLRFEGRVHELIEPALQRIKFPLLTSKIILHHYGQTKQVKEGKHKSETYQQLGEQKLREGESSFQTLWELGIQYVHNKQYERALEALTQASKLVPESIAVWRSIGAAQYYLKRYDEAIDSLCQSLAIDATNAETHANIAMLYAETQQPILAEAHFKRALSLRKDSINSYCGLARFYMARARIPEAISVLEDALNRCPNGEEVKELHKIALKMRGQRSVAGASIQGAASSSFQSPRENS